MEFRPPPEESVKQGPPSTTTEVDETQELQGLPVEPPEQQEAEESLNAKAETDVNSEVGGNEIESNGTKDTIEPSKDTSNDSDLSKQ